MGNFTVRVSSKNESKFGGGFQEFKDFFDNMVRNLSAELFDEPIRYVNLTGESILEGVYEEGFSDITFVNNATFEGIEVEKHALGNVELFGKTIDTSNVLCPHGSGELITSPEGYPVAEYYRDKKAIIILPNLNKSGTDDERDVLDGLYNEWLKVHFKTENIEDMIEVARKERKDREVKLFIDGMSAQLKRDVENIKYELQREQEQIENSKQSLRRHIIKRDRLINKEPMLKKQLAEVSEDLESEFDLIRKYPKVKDFKIDNGKLVVFTDVIYAYTQHGDRYYMGEYKIEINPSNTSIRYFNDEGREGYWTESDPHPHVNGSDGNPCLGNVSETIAELSAQFQLYPLVTIAIDFLESVNTDDSAGQNVIHWDKVDESGNIIEEGDPIEEL